MASTAAAAIASSFSTTMQSLHCSVRRSRTTDYNCFTSFKLVASSTRIITPPQNIALVSSSSLLSSAHSFKWRAVSSLAAAVAQEEAPAAVTADEEEAVTAVAEEEEGVVEEKGGDGSDQSNGEVVNTKLYFGNLPYHCDSAQLAGIVQDYATPELIEVLYDRESGKSRGFAFVTMSSIEDCYTVIENLGGREYGGRTLRVNFSDKPKPKEPLYPETEHKLFVGNLAWSASSEILTQAFKEYGNVVGARVLYDGETGRSRGYGFVSFETKEQMENAIQNLDGVDLEGRPMRISLAQGKKQ